MKFGKRIRVNARLPDHDGKFRDEITQEVTVEMDDPTLSLEDLAVKVSEEIDSQMVIIFEKIKELGGRDYTAS